MLELDPVGGAGLDPMARALVVARRGDHQTSPNPMVGAVVARDGRVVAEGHHARAGDPHAEIVALEHAGAASEGAHLYVTLEPCCHWGRTGPCTETLLQAGLAAVHVATLDPNPKVAGQGVARLRQAGLEVVLGEREAEAQALIEEFRVWVTTGIPFVTLKFAASLDGKVATAAGRSQWITSSRSRERAHQLRREHDAVMVGSGTVLADDPRLTARGGHPADRQPLRVVVDGRLRTPPGARLLGEPEGRVLIATTSGSDRGRRDAIARAGAEVLELPEGDGRVSLEALLAELGRRQVTSVLVEGGPTLLGSFLERRLGNRLVAFLAPLLLGGSGAPGPFGGPGVDDLEAGWELRSLRAEPVGRDLLLVAEV
ncbi:MAG: bifunctional diaminohydroxyphosphoribosylaminopyrimidine deaminase/5-amino-6-(5-phosphoribosylamino)uracil reductase RibD [Candidatus Dormibacteria bacterium]